VDNNTHSISCQYAELRTSHQMKQICGAPTSSRRIPSCKEVGTRSHGGFSLGEGQSITALTETCKGHLQGRHARNSRRSGGSLPQHCRLPSIQYPPVVPVQGPNPRFSPHRGAPVTDHFPISKKSPASDAGPNSANVL
jgi:hypothetical protein